MVITIEMSIEAYKTAQKIYEGLLTKTEGKKEIHLLTGMNEGSAHDYITIFLAMMSGSVYKRAFNNSTNKILFESIRHDYGDTQFRKALTAAQQHVDYYSTLNKGNLTGLQRIIDQMS